MDLVISGQPDYHFDKILSTITFGSCNKHNLEQKYWKRVLERNPDLWIWLGDVVYTDYKMVPFLWMPSPLETTQSIYEAQKQRPEYKAVLESNTSIIGIWDDHDYGINGGGKIFKYRLQSQKAFLDFVDEPLDSQRRSREGIYTSYTYGTGDRIIKVILLDVRSHDIEGSNCDVLGDKQWEWLDDQLKDKKSFLIFIGSGKQVLSDVPFIDKWMSCDASLDKLLFLAQRRPRVIFLTGDVHFSEVNCLNSSGTGYPIYEVTSSGLTHSCSASLLPSGICMWTLKNVVASRYRVANVVTDKSFGSIKIDWDSNPIKLKIELIGDQNVLSSLDISLDDLAVKRYPSSCPQGVEQPNWYLKRLFWFSVIFGAVLCGLIALRITFLICRLIAMRLLKDFDANIKRRINKLKFLLTSYRPTRMNNTAKIHKD